VRTIRDTRRNLGLFDFINRHAEREADQLYLEQWRPYVLRINATASAMQELEKGNFEEAHGILDTAIHTIENLPNLDVETFKEEKQRALKTLHSIVDQIKNVRPQSELERLEKELKKAVQAQEFELAAKLRDRIRGMREQTKPPPEATP
jgi:excinuclease UvrABC helicase subunit UvrB